MREQHGLSKTRTYKTWEMMIQRCHNPKFDGFFRYGGRGIFVCDAWRASFLSFLSDMGHRPVGTTLDRIDVNTGYSKENCRWVGQSEQRFNTRMPDRNSSGRTGVRWHKGGKKWSAEIGVEGKNIFLGLFTEKASAVRAREEAELKYYGFIKEGQVEIEDPEDAA